VGLILVPAQEWRLTLEFVLQTAGNGLLILACSVVGALIVSRRPDNIIGWIYTLVALVLAASQVPGGYATRSLPGSAWVALLPDLLWLAVVPVGVTLLMLLFPTGQLPSRRWRLVVWATVGATAVAVVATALTPGPVEYFPGHQNPLGLAGAGPLLEVVAQVGFVVIVAGVFAAAGSLIVRWRRTGGVERQQMKWLAYAAAMMVVAQIFSSFLPRPLFLVVSYTAFLLFPVALGIAVLRYRLYELDRLINRTLVYGLLTALLAVVYSGVVLVLGQVFGGVGGDPPSWAVAGATLAVAALFQPARRRIQAVVDRRFNRRRYNAARTIEVFSARLRDEVDLDTLSAELLTVIDQTMQPTAVSLWLRPPLRRSRTGT
jgi:N-terminal 7TM region of histidine kinase